jgi:hypothetical protein
MATFPDLLSRPVASSVWCTLCLTNLAGASKVIIAHFRSSHGRAPTSEEIQKVLSNTTDKKFLNKRKKRKVRGTPSDKFVDKDIEHNVRWSKIIQAGAPGLGKKR